MVELDVVEVLEMRPVGATRNRNAEIKRGFLDRLRDLDIGRIIPGQDAIDIRREVNREPADVPRVERLALALVDHLLLALFGAQAFGDAEVHRRNRQGRVHDLDKIGVDALEIAKRALGE